MPNRLPFPLALIAALASGGLLGLSYAPVAFWPAAILGVAAITWLTTSQPGGGRAALVGYLAGLGMNAATISWIGVLGWYVAVALVAFMSLWFALLGWALYRLDRLRWAPAWWAAAWVAMEFGLSSVPLGGFGWIRLAFTTADQPISGFLPVVGVAGVSFLVALAGGLLLAQVRFRRTIIPGALLVALLVVGGVLKFVPDPTPDATVTIGVVQGNVDGVGHGRPGYARSVTNNHLSETITLLAHVRTGLAKPPDFVLWPENSTDMDPIKDADTRSLIVDSVRLTGVPILVGAVMEGPGPDERQTTGLVWTSEGPSSRYDKRNLVPFGEWIPFRDVLLPRMPILKQIGRQGVPGTEPGVLDVSVGDRVLKVGDVICFELAYDTTVYDTLRGGAQVLVVQSNNATYAGTGQTYQQFEITRVRAMEARREIVVATTNSFSGMIGTRGDVLAKTDEGVAASASFTVPLRAGLTTGVLLQPWLSYLLTLAALAGIALSYRRPSVAQR